MNGLDMTDVRCAVLFASGLQQSDAPTGSAVAEAVQRTVRQFGVRGCAGRMAQEFGDHPEAARDRMRWVRQLAAEISASSRPRAPGPRPAVPGAPPDQLSLAAPYIYLEGLSVPCDTTTAVFGEPRRARGS